jgi:hypothetical protein
VQQLRFVSRGIKSLDANVIAQVERRCIYPERTAEASPGYVEDLTESAKEVQATFDRLLRGIDPKATVRIQEAAAVEDSQGTDVLRPDFIRPEDKPVFRSAAPTTPRDDHAELLRRSARAFGPSKRRPPCHPVSTRAAAGVNEFRRRRGLCG